MIHATTRTTRKTISQLADQYLGQLRHHAIEADLTEVTDSIRSLMAGNSVQSLTETFIRQWLQNDLRGLIEVVDA